MRSVLPECAFAGFSAFVAAVFLVPAGCQQDLPGLFRTHLSDTRKADARKHWDSMRGTVKLQLAEKQLESGALDEAEKTLEQAVALSPDSARVHLLKARLELEKGELSKARNAVREAAALSSEDAEIEYVAGIIAQRYGDLDAALRHYYAAADADPQASAYIVAEAELLVALDRPIEAMELIESRLDDFESNVPLRMLAARVSQVLGLRGPAVDYCREAARLGEDDAALAVELGRMLVWAGRYDEAVAVLRPLVDEALAKDPDFNPLVAGAEQPITSSALNALGEAYLAIGRCADAQRAVKPVMAHDPVDAVAWCHYARGVMMQGDFPAAARAMEKLHAAGAASAESLLLAAYVNLQTGDNSRAFDAAARSVQLDGNSAVGYCLLGRACEGLGRFEEARRAYATALALDPGLGAAQALLNRLAPEHGGSTPAVDASGDPSPAGSAAARTAALSTERAP